MKRKSNKFILWIIIAVVIILALAIGIIFYLDSMQSKLSLGASCGASIEGCCGNGLDCYDNTNDDSDVVGLCYEEGILFVALMDEGEKCQS